MENIVYILGAGFSRPLGLPLTSDFLSMSKDLLAKDPERFGHFRGIYERLRGLTPAMTFVELDLLNIEEILSLIEMQSYAVESGDPIDFVSFICDVIQGTTPDDSAISHLSWIPRLFGAGIWHPYAAFAGNIAGVRLIGPESGDEPPHFEAVERQDVSYSVVTLNYDTAIESPLECIGKRAHPRSGGRHDIPIRIAKLHGDVRARNVVAPTWIKDRRASVATAWKNAFEWLRAANQIRVLGYSLPPGDSYVKYLLAIALAESENLRRIDVFCLDPTESVSARYRQMFKFRDLGFWDVDISEYLRWSDLCVHDGATVDFNNLERWHVRFRDQVFRSNRRF